MEPEPQFNHISKHLHNANGLPIGKVGENPILDTRKYKVEYSEEEKSDLYANLISENMFTHIDKEGNHHVLMDKITDHRFYEAAVKSQDAFGTTYSGTKYRMQTPQGVILCIKWRDGNKTWVALKDTKEA